MFKNNRNNTKVTHGHKCLKVLCTSLPNIIMIHKRK